MFWPHKCANWRCFIESFLSIRSVPWRPLPMVKDTTGTKRWTECKLFEDVLLKANDCWFLYVCFFLGGNVSSRRQVFNDPRLFSEPDSQRMSLCATNLSSPCANNICGFGSKQNLEGTLRFSAMPNAKRSLKYPFWGWIQTTCWVFKCFLGSFTESKTLSAPWRFPKMDLWRSSPLDLRLKQLPSSSWFSTLQIGRLVA